MSDLRLDIDIENQGTDELIQKLERVYALLQQIQSLSSKGQGASTFSDPGALAAVYTGARNEIRNKSGQTGNLERFEEAFQVITGGAQAAFEQATGTRKRQIAETLSGVGSSEAQRYLAQQALIPQQKELERTYSRVQGEAASENRDFDRQQTRRDRQQQSYERLFAQADDRERKEADREGKRAEQESLRADRERESKEKLYGRLFVQADERDKRIEERDKRIEERAEPAATRQMSRERRVLGSLQRQKEREYRSAEREAYEEEETPQREMSQEFTEQRLRSFTSRMVASALNQGVDPLKNPYIRTRLARIAGSDDDASIQQAYRESLDMAKIQGSLRFRGLTRLAGYSTAAGMLAGEASQLATGYFGTTASGEAYRPEEESGGIGRAIGTGIGAVVGGAVFKNPLGVALGAGAGAMIGGWIGAPFEAYAKAQRGLQDKTLGFSAAYGLPYGEASSLSRRFGAMAGPVGGPIGQTAAQGILQTLLAPTFLGTGSYQNVTDLAQSMIGEHGRGASMDAQALAPFLSNPLYGRDVLAEKLGGGRFLNASSAAGMTITGGAAAAFNAVTNLNRPDLAHTVQEFNETRIRGALASSITGGESGIASSRFAYGLATGAAIDSPMMRGEAQNQESKLAAHADAIRKNIENLKRYDDAIGPVHDELVKQRGELAATQTALQQFQQSVHQQTVQLGTLRIETRGAQATAAYTAGGYGLAPGSLNPATGQQETYHRDALANAVARANDPQLSAEERESWRQQIPGLRNLIALDDPRARLMQTYGAPAQAAAAVSGRASALLAQSESFGYGPDRVDFSQPIGAATRNVARQQALLTATQGAYGRHQATYEEVDSARSSLQESQMQLRALRRNAAYYGSDFQMAGAGYATSEAEGAYGIRSRLGLGPNADMESARNLLSTRASQISAVESRIETARTLKDDREVMRLQNQANLLRQGAAGDFLSAMTTYRPSAKDQVALENSGLAERLAESDLGMGGVVPMGLRRYRMGLLGQQIGGIESRIAAAPAGLRDTVAAALNPQRAQLLEQMAQERNALQFGDLGHLIDIGVGQPGNYRLRSGANAAMFQRYNPGGNRALGGTGESVALSPFVQTALSGGVSRALGGTGGFGANEGTGEIIAVLNRIAEGVERGGGSAGRSMSPSPFAGRDVDYDPREQVRRSTFGTKQ